MNNQKMNIAFFILFSLATTLLFIASHFVFMKLLPEQSMSHVGIFANVFLAVLLACILSYVFKMNNRFVLTKSLNEK